MSEPAVSVIVVSLDRPKALRRCLMGIEQLDYPEFEVIVVADPGGLAALDAEGFSSRIKTLSFDVPNISRARNLGLAQAAGELVAFIDDDAVPEPTWLTFLTQPFQDTRVAAAGGYVIGRNGISLQHGARMIDRFGDHAPIATQGNAAQVLDPPDAGAVKTEGTNCAFRRDLLLQMGGFDPAFAFYMDETDLNLRLAKAGAKTAIVPMAQVHHGFAASARRTQDRMPKTLFDIGASQIVLLRKHAGTQQVGPVLDRVRSDQRARLIRNMVAGTCEPRDVGHLMETLEAGFQDGETRPIHPPQPIAAGEAPFRRFEPRIRFETSGHLAGRSWTAALLRNEARRRVRAGERTTLILLSPTAFFHRVRFTDDGFWEQTGGLFGKSDRNGPLVRVAGFRRRVIGEIARVRQVRGLPIG
ncbi:MAG: glycosyltransferase [Rhodobacter sp.]|nr:glycosyltransferase [Rhodobacter sp.]